MAGSFEPTILERLHAIEEVEIETRGREAGSAHRTIIWVVADERDRVFVRSVRAGAGRWYREAVAHPACVLHLGEVAIPVEAVAAADPEQVAACSRELLVKYAKDPATPSMLREAALATTLRLLPR